MTTSSCTHSRCTDRFTCGNADLTECGTLEVEVMDMTTAEHQAIERLGDNVDSMTSAEYDEYINLMEL